MQAGAAAARRVRTARIIAPRPLAEFWLALALIVLLASSYLAFRPEPWPGYFGVPLSHRWWKTLLAPNPGGLPSIGAWLYGITAVPDSEVVIAVGTDGAVMRSRDGGHDWDKLIWTGPEAGQTLRGVSFASANEGWAVGDDATIVHSVNGGAAWTAEKAPAGVDGTLYDIAAAPASRKTAQPAAIAVGQDGVLLLNKPSNGADAWSRDNVPGNLGLRSVALRGQTALAAGGARLILRSTDGGIHWTTVNSGTNDSEDLYVVRFAADGSAWAVGQNGLALESRDDGQTWSHGTPANAFKNASEEGGNAPDLYGVAPDGAGRLTVTGSAMLYSNRSGRWVASVSPTLFQMLTLTINRKGEIVGGGSTGGIIISPDGEHWEARSLGGVGAFEDALVLPDGATFVAGSGGLVGASTPAGRFHPVAAGSQSEPQTDWQRFASLPDGQNAWLFGAYGEILHTGDGGRTWTAMHGQPEGRDAKMSMGAFGDTEHGVIVGRNGAWVTSDGGRTWQQKFTGNLTAAAYSGGMHAVLADGQDSIFYSDDGGVSWTQAKTDTTNRWIIDDIVLRDASHGWLTGAGGTLMRSDDGGRTWKNIAAGQPAVPLTQMFWLGDDGWIVGAQGNLGMTTDGGRSWQWRRIEPQFDLWTIAFRDPKDGIAAGSGGRILLTSDGGKNWAQYAAPHWPSLWFYASWILVGLLAVPALRSPPPEELDTDSVANLLVSDEPIASPEGDSIGMARIAAGLSQFLRNASTAPPLTIAITGPWGMGKSSLMNLLSADLRACYFRPVWFNAWHHQQDKNVLASLYDAIRRSGLPTLFSVEGWLFRMRLLARRCRRNLPWLCLLLVLASAAGGYLIAQPAEQRRADMVNIARVIKDRNLSSLTQGGEDWLLFLASAASLLGLVADSLKGFGIRVQDLIAHKDGARRPYQVKLAQNFGDVTAALAPRRLVLFVDDLDRCEPAYVMQVLEAINFLTSSGEVFVVMGLAPAPVRAAVGLAFKDMAEEIVKFEMGQRSQSDAAGKEELSRRKREEYASQYLHKLVNMEIPVPEIGAQAATRVLSGRAMATAPARRRRRRRMNALVGGLAVAACAAGAFWVGARMAQPPSQDIHAVQAGGPAEQNAGASAAAPGVLPAAGAQPPAVHASQPALALMQPEELPPLPAPPRIRWAVMGPILFVWIALAIWVLRRRVNLIVRDSDQFTEALAIWQPLIQQLFSTPRDLKRFLNKVRYLAMLQLPTVAEPSFFDLIRGYLRKTPPQEVAAGTLSDTALVGLAAMDEAEGLAARNDAALTECMARHHEVFQETLDSPALAQYRALSQGLKVR